MKEDTMKINGAEYPVLGNNSAIIAWEKETGKPFSKLESHTENLLFLFFSVKAGARREKKIFDMDFDTFVDYIDEHPEAMPKKQQNTGTGKK